MACCTITTLIWPGEFDFEVLRRMNFAAVDFEDRLQLAAKEEAEADPEGSSKTTEMGDEKVSPFVAVPDATEEEIPINNRTEATELEMYADFKFSVIATIGVFILMSVRPRTRIHCLPKAISLISTTPLYSDYHPSLCIDPQNLLLVRIHGLGCHLLHIHGRSVCYCYRVAGIRSKRHVGKGVSRYKKGFGWEFEVVDGVWNMI